MKKLIAAIEALPEASYSSTGTVYLSQVTDLIETMLAGKVIVNKLSLEMMENDITYAAFNLLNGESPENFDAMLASVSRIVETTSPSDTLLIAIRNLKAMLSTIGEQE